MKTNASPVGGRGLVGQINAALDSGRLLGGSRTTRGSYLRGLRRPPAFLSLRKFAFGITAVNHAALTITLNGSIVMGLNDQADIDGETVAVGGTAAAPHVIYAEGAIVPLAGEIATASVAVSSWPVHTETLWRRPLYRVYVRDGLIVVALIYHLGLVDLKTWYGP